MLLDINPEHPEPRKIARAVDALASGEVIAYPTDTVYALGCDFNSKKAMERLYTLKNMPRSHPLALLCADLSNIATYAQVENQVYRVLRRFLPGPYCFILPATREVPKNLLSKQRTIGIRVPASPVTQAMVNALGRPILTTSAGPSGQDALIDPKEIDEMFRGLALVLDGGAGGLLPTSVIDLTVDPAVVVRAGVGPVDEFSDEDPVPNSLRGPYSKRSDR